MDIESIISGSIQTFLKANDLYGKNKFNTVILKLSNVIYNNSICNINVIIYYYPQKDIYHLHMFNHKYTENIDIFKIDIMGKKGTISFIHLWCKNYMKLSDNSNITFSFWKQDAHILDINQINYNSSNYISFFVDTPNKFIENLETSLSLLESVVHVYAL